MELRSAPYQLTVAVTTRKNHQSCRHCKPQLLLRREQETVYQGPNMTDHGPGTQAQVTPNNIVHIGAVIRTFVVTEGNKTQINSFTKYTVGDIS